MIKNLPFKEVFWENIRDEVKLINSQLFDIIERISPDKRYPLIKAEYNFGDMIVKNGIANIPNIDGILTAITSQNFPSKIKKQLDYSPIPLFLVLKNASEVFVETASRNIPLNIFYPGKLLGLFESLDYLVGRKSTSKWCVSAGARNLFTLPKINEESGFKKLKIAFNLDSNMKPRYLSDHWEIFSKIAQHKNFNYGWKNEVIFFTKNWFNNNSTEREWLIFKDYLFKSAWYQAQFAINKTSLNLSWENFSAAISARKLKPIPYLMDHIKQLMLIASGRMSGFRPADNSNQAGPLNKLQQALVDIYGLKKYFPTMMHLCSIESETHLPMYYSLSYPTLLEGLPFNHASNSTLMIDLRAIKHLIDTIKPLFKNMQDSTWSDAEFEFFHVEPDKYNEILKSELLAVIDKNTLINYTEYPNKEFCVTSQFWRGCIRITNPGNKQNYDELITV